MPCDQSGEWFERCGTAEQSTDRRLRAGGRVRCRGGHVKADPPRRLRADLRIAHDGTQRRSPFRLKVLRRGISSPARTDGRIDGLGQNPAPTPTAGRQQMMSRATFHGGRDVNHISLANRLSRHGCRMATLRQQPSARRSSPGDPIGGRFVGTGPGHQSSSSRAAAVYYAVGQIQWAKQRFSARDAISELPPPASASARHNAARADTPRPTPPSRPSRYRSRDPAAPHPDPRRHGLPGRTLNNPKRGRSRCSTAAGQPCGRAKSRN
jgi:hypothetical protein